MESKGLFIIFSAPLKGPIEDMYRPPYLSGDSDMAGWSLYDFQGEKITIFQIQHQ